MRKRAAVIANPASGRGQGDRKAQFVAGRLHGKGLEVDHFQTVSAGHARAYANRFCNDVDVLISVGGDGTLNEIVNGVVEAGSKTPICIIPTGTANVVSRELGLPSNLEALTDLAADGGVRSLDLGLAGERLFTMCAGIGFDAKIVDMVSRSRSGDGITMLDYTIPTVQTLAGYKFPRMKVFVDGELAESDATFVVIGNMRRYGGPFQLFERATPDDGKLDVCCLRGRHALDLLRYSWNAFWKTLAKQPDVFYHLADRVRVESDQKVLVQVDGDQGGELPMDFQVLPGAVNFCVSDHNPHGESAAEKAVANTSC